MAGWAREHPEATKAALKGLAPGVLVLGSGAALAALTLLGGPAMLLSGVAAGATAVATGMEHLDAALHKFLPGVFGPQITTDGKTYDPARDGPIYDPSKHGLPSRLWNHPGGTLFGFQGRDMGPAPGFHHSSYATPANSNRPIVVHTAFQMDGRTVARGVMAIQERTASRDPSGITGFDGRQTMLPPSVTTTSA